MKHKKNAVIAKEFSNRTATDSNRKYVSKLPNEVAALAALEEELNFQNMLISQIVEFYWQNGRVFELWTTLKDTIESIEKFQRQKSKSDVRIIKIKNKLDALRSKQRPKND